MRNFMSCNKTVEGVLKHFDFDKVHSVMKALDWKWVGALGNTSTTGLLSQNYPGFVEKILVLHKTRYPHCRE